LRLQIYVIELVFTSKLYYIYTKNIRKQEMGLVPQYRRLMKFFAGTLMKVFTGKVICCLPRTNYAGYMR